MEIKLPDRQTIQARIEELRQELRKLVAVEDALKRAEPRQRRTRQSAPRKAADHA